VEEHLRAQESFIADVNLAGCPSQTILMTVLLKFIGLYNLSGGLIECLLIKLLVLLDNVLANVAESLLYLLCDFH
jgi:hypothetical protein